MVTWYKDGHVVREDFSHVMTMNGAVLTVRDVQSSDRGRYECRVTDRPTGQLARRHTFVVTEGGMHSSTQDLQCLLSYLLTLADLKFFVQIYASMYTSEMTGV